MKTKIWPYQRMQYFFLKYLIANYVKIDKSEYIYDLCDYANNMYNVPIGYISDIYNIIIYT